MVPGTHTGCETPLDQYRGLRGVASVPGLYHEVTGLTLSGSLRSPLCLSRSRAILLLSPHRKPLLLSPRPQVAYQDPVVPAPSTSSLIVLYLPQKLLETPLIYSSPRLRAVVFLQTELERHFQQSFNTSHLDTRSGSRVTQKCQPVLHRTCKTGPCSCSSLEAETHLPRGQHHRIQGSCSFL